MGEREIVCGNCGSRNEPTATFCANCGALLAAYQSPVGATAPVGEVPLPEAASPGPATASAATVPPVVPPVVSPSPTPQRSAGEGDGAANQAPAGSTMRALSPTAPVAPTPAASGRVVPDAVSTGAEADTTASSRAPSVAPSTPERPAGGWAPGAPSVADDKRGAAPATPSGSPEPAGGRGAARPTPSPEAGGQPGEVGRYWGPTESASRSDADEGSATSGEGGLPVAPSSAAPRWGDTAGGPPSTPGTAAASPHPAGEGAAPPPPSYPGWTPGRAASPTSTRGSWARGVTGGPGGPAPRTVLAAGLALFLGSCVLSMIASAADAGGLFALLLFCTLPLGFLTMIVGGVLSVTRRPNRRP